MKIIKKMLIETISIFMLFTICCLPVKAYEITEDQLVKNYNIVSQEKFSINDHSKIVIIENEKTKNNEELKKFIQLVNAEGGNRFSIYLGKESKAKDGDVVVSLNDNNQTNFDEEYHISINHIVKIDSSSSRGILYALRTFNNFIEHNQLNYAQITDYPDVKERALHLDMARKYYTKDWIIKRIKQMSFLKLNTLQLHFSDNEGFRIESKRHPEIMSDEYLTQDEVKEIIRVGKEYGVDIIPSLDAPGHLKQALKQHPEYQLKINVTDEEGNIKQTRLSKALDITNDEAVVFIKDLYSEYADLFSSSHYFHVGADEFLQADENVSGTVSIDQCYELDSYAKEKVGENASAIDAYVYYLNDIASFMENKGFTVRCWNDYLYRSDLNQTLDAKSSIQVCYWTKMFPYHASVQTFIDKGHKVMNYCDKADPLMDGDMTDSFMYYVNSQRMYSHPKADNIYKYWHPGLFSNWKILGNPKQEYQLGSYPNALQGASFAIWNDTASESEEDTEINVKEPLTAMALKSWNADINQKITEFSMLKDFDQMIGYNNDLPAFKQINYFDEVAPVITGKDATIEVGTKGTVEEIIGLNVKDDVDAHPTVTVTVEPQFNVYVVGKYKVKVTAIDNSNNETYQEFTINVVEKRKEDKKVQQGTESKTSKVKTGDTTEFIPYVLLILFTCIAFILLKRKENN